MSDTISDGKKPSDRRLHLFAYLIAITSMTHMVSFQWWTDVLPGQILFCTTLLLFFFPASLLTLGIFLGTSIFHWFNLMPLVPNHVFFELIVHLTLVAAIAPSLFRGINEKLRGPTKTRHSSISNEIFTSVRPYIRLELIILYLFTVLHKLNFDFFDPETSCAVSMHGDVAAVLPGIPTGPWTHWPTIIGTILIETAIPLLFLMKATRSIGISIGIVFHLFLALHPHGGIYSFTNLLLTLYLLLLSDEAIDWIILQITRIPIVARVSFKIIMACGFCFAVYSQRSAVLEGRPFTDLNSIGFKAWLPIALGISACYLLAIAVKFQKSKNESLQQTERVKIHRPLNPILCLFPILVLINGSSPYLGLKTTTAFAMFSNLRTEGGKSNHFFLANYEVFSYQTDLVRVLNANDPQFFQLITRGDLVPWFEFKRMISKSNRPDLEIVCLRRDQPLVLKRLAPDHNSDDAFEALPWLPYKFLHFHSISDFDQPMKCCW